MALKDLIQLSKKVHTINLYDNEIHFSELGYDQETTAREAGTERAKRIHGKDVEAHEIEQLANLYVVLEMLRAGGEDVTDDEFFSISSDYHGELSLSISNVLQNEVHTEHEKLERAIREKLKRMTGTQKNTE